MKEREGRRDQRGGKGQERGEGRSWQEARGEGGRKRAAECSGGQA